MAPTNTSKSIRRISKWTVRTLLFLLTAWVIMAQGCLRMRISDSEAMKKFREKGVPMQLQDYKYAGKTIHYALTGCDTCETLLLLHGSPGSWDTYERYLADTALRQAFRIISIDRPGFGHSNYGDAMPISKQAPMIAALLQQLDNGKRVIVAGHSLGGPLAVLLAGKYPANVQGLLLFAASVDPAEEKAERWRPVLKVFPLNLLLPGAFRPSNIELWAFKKDVKLMPAMLQQIHCPVIIVQGMKDDLVPAGNAYYAQSQLLHADTVRMIMLPGENHFIPWTQFDVLKAAMLEMKALMQRQR
jgi:pimeloyl-ACP methyl ester carboxylesterase